MCQPSWSAVSGGEEKTNLSSVSASRYAFNTNHAINTRSPRKNTQLRKADHENSKCTTNNAVNSRLDCHAWNLRSHHSQHDMTRTHSKRPPTRETRGNTYLT